MPNCTHSETARILKYSSRSTIGRRDYGMGISHKTDKGNEISTAAPYEIQRNTKRKFKILTLALIDLGCIG